MTQMERVCSSEWEKRFEGQTLSNLSLLDDYDKDNAQSDRLIDCLIDPRCDKFENFEPGTELYPCPSLLQHFDFNGISDYLMLHRMINFNACQLGLWLGS